MRLKSYSLFVVMLTCVVYFGSNYSYSDTDYPKYNYINLVGFYNNPDGVPIVALLDAAKTSIHMEMYEMGNVAVLSAMRRALDRGVEVQVVQEGAPVGEPCKIFTAVTYKDLPVCQIQKKLVNDVNQRGGVYVPFNKSKFCTGLNTDESRACLEHGKMILVDQKFAFVSSGNLNPTNLCDLKENPSVCNRDYSVIIDDAPSVAALEFVFQKDRQDEEYDAQDFSKLSLRAEITVGPYTNFKILDLIHAAKKSIRIENQYLYESNLNEALNEAAQRGVQVAVTVASACAFGRPSAARRKQVEQIFSQFDALGMKSRFFTKKVMIQNKPGYLHAKAIVVDDEKAWIGSVNGSTQAMTRNREFGVFFQQKQWVKKLSRVMDQDHQDPGTESWEESLNCLKDR